MDTSGKYKYVNIFNSLLKQLITFTVKKSKMAKFANLQNRAFLAIKTDPMIAITEAGPYLLKYAVAIKSYNIDEMLSHDFTDDTKDANDDDRAEILNVIKLIKNICSKKCNNRERHMVMDKLDDMLIAYCEYIG